MRLSVYVVMCVIVRLVDVVCVDGSVVVWILF